MTTFTPTDDTSTIDPVPPPPPRALRRSRDDRIAAGLSGGLGRYFGVDPVIFRIAFVVLALFGGSGILLYLIGWVAVPEDGAANAPLDGFIARLRRRSVPLWLAVVVAAIVLSALASNWWGGFPLFPAVVVVGALALLLSRRDRRITDAPLPLKGSAAPLAPTSDTIPLDPASVQLRSWIDESRTRAQQRRARSGPLTRITGAALIAALAVLVVVDVVAGIPFGVYFWVTGAIVLTALVTGLVLRRTPRLISLLLVPIGFGLIVFGAGSGSAHDGAGTRDWRPSSAAELRDTYRLGFGRSTLDLRDLSAGASGRTVHVKQAAGEIQILLPAGVPVRIDGHVHQGAITSGDTNLVAGWNADYTYATPGSDGAAAVTIDADLTAGRIDIVPA